MKQRNTVVVTKKVFPVKNCTHRYNDEADNAQNPLHTFPRNFPRTPVDGEAANLLQTGYGLVVYVADLLWTCYGETGVMDFGVNQCPLAAEQTSTLYMPITFVVYRLMNAFIHLKRLQPNKLVNTQAI